MHNAQLIAVRRLAFVDQDNDGTLVRLRYSTIPAKRQELFTYIIEILLREFGKEYPRVRFDVPALNIRYKLDDAEGTVQAAAPPITG